MTRSLGGPVISLRGVRHNNLKNIDLDLPLRSLIVVTGLSGSGKSSLAFDTLFAEGQRRYIETFSPYARQFFDRMDKPQVDRIEGIPPAIAIEQRNAVKSTRSTVGTMTGLCEFMKLLWPHVSHLYCRQCGQEVIPEPPARIWEQVKTATEGASGSDAEVLITFDLALSDKLSLEDSLALVSRQGYQRLLIGGAAVRLEESAAAFGASAPDTLTVIQDRLPIREPNRARFAEACEQAYHFGKKRLAVHWLSAGGGIRQSKKFSRGMHCATCDLDYREPAPALFSFNNPVGACPSCKGFGRIITIDYRLAIPDPRKTLAEGAVRPWQTGQSAECQDDLMRMCRKHGVPTDVPFERLEARWRDWVIEGEPGYGTSPSMEWPRAWYGVKGYFKWLEGRTYKMHVRVLLSRYRAYSPCPECNGSRLQPEALLFKAPAAKAVITLPDFYQMTIDEALATVEGWIKARPRIAGDPIQLLFGEVRSRLAYLSEVGVGYLTMDRPTRSLSGGETERVNLTSCLGSQLVNTLYVLDEPSVGLHPRDTARLVAILRRLRDIGNTVVVVEHEAAVMRAADQIVDLGPGHGETGGEIVFQGPYSELLRSAKSLTGQYLSGRKRLDPLQRRPVEQNGAGRLILTGAACHNLKNLDVEIPLGRFVCLTGVSGSGKTTLAREVLLPALTARLRDTVQPESENAAATENEEGSEQEVGDATHCAAGLRGAEQLGGVVLVDQSPVGRTPRSNPAVYIGAFDDLRELFAQGEAARELGLGPSAFSFNSAQGQCERCRGAGFEKIEMQFLSDVFVRCPECNGRRYRAHILEAKLQAGVPEQPAREPVTPVKKRGSKSKGEASEAIPAKDSNAAAAEPLSWSIADLLEATVDQVLEFLMSWFHVPAGRRAAQTIKLLQEAGLGYLRLGQPLNTLSGGESQRLKLVSHLAEFAKDQHSGRLPTLFVFDEPTTGLHFEDIRILLKLFQRLVDRGHSLLVIEHNMDIIRNADWVIDLGPEAGEQGGQIVVQGTPETVAACAQSHTGQALSEVLPQGRTNRQTKG